MQYPFFVNNFDRVKNFRTAHPNVGKIFEYPVSFWYGDRHGKDVKYLDHGLTRLFNRSYPHLPVLVLYNLPNRDIGHYSKGGAKTRSSYLNYVSSFTKGIGSRSPIVIYEPDALAHVSHMSKREATARTELMRDAIEIIVTGCNAYLYIDIGHSNWLDLVQASKLLGEVSHKKMRGFAVNVSNYRTTLESMRYALQLCELRPKDHFIIDTSRNGNGPYGNEWCNPPGRALGIPPTCDTGNDKCDAFLWVKIPGESDGKRNGGPRAGRFWPEMAEVLISNFEQNQQKLNPEVSPNTA